MKKNTKEFLEENLIIILSLCLILVVLLLRVSLINQPEKQAGEPLPTPEEELISPVKVPFPPLSFVLEENYFLKPSTSFSLEVVPDQSLSASVYRLEILFDPGILKVEEVLPGDFFETPQILRKEIDNQEGRVDFSAGISLEEKTAKGEPKNKNPFAIVIFQVKSLSEEEELYPTTISFGKKTTLIYEEEWFENLNQELKPIIITTKTAHE